MINPVDYLDKRIAVQSIVHEEKYVIYRRLIGINKNGTVNVLDTDGNMHTFPVSRLEDPAKVITDMSLIVEFK